MSSQLGMTFQDWLCQVYPELPCDLRLADQWVTDLYVDSRLVTEHSVFIAVQGLTVHGAEFANAALHAGAVAVLVDSNDQYLLNQIDIMEQAYQHQLVKVPQLSQHLAILLECFYKNVQMVNKIAVTGTNGKTTVSQLAAQLLYWLNIQERYCSVSGVIGTLGAGRIVGTVEQVAFLCEYQTTNTTPHLADTYRMMSHMAEIGVKSITMEVSSIGIDQLRVKGLNFDVVIMTNLTQDHLDYHGDIHTYAEVKKQLFVTNPTASMVFNLDDEIAANWCRYFAQDHRVIAVGAAMAEHDFSEFLFYQEVQYTLQGLTFRLISHQGEFTVSLGLLGLFNLNNVLCAMAAAVALGHQVSDLIQFSTQLHPVPGRMQAFDYAGVMAVVDYAHTPDALRQSLHAVRLHCTGQLWCIFGCGGDRDKSKRPLMAQAAAQYADHILVTNDNPRNECPSTIAQQVCSGFDQSTKYAIELDRKKAIQMTLAAARDGDVVLIAGKGHETYQIFGDDVIEYDELSYVRQCCVDKSNEVVAS